MNHAAGNISHEFSASCFYQLIVVRNRTYGQRIRFYGFITLIGRVILLMGLKPRLRVILLPQKLKQIRESMGFSQNEMLRQLGYEDFFDRSTISHYESGEREPPLPVLLAYARAANVLLEVLVDDKLELPDILPARNFK